MRLTLARHPVTDIRFETATRLEGTWLFVDVEALRWSILEDDSLQNVDFETVGPGETCRAAPVFDIIEPRAKEARGSQDFPGILGSPVTAGMGTTHLLVGVAVTVLGERAAGGSGGAIGRVLEMSGPAAGGSPYSSLNHLIVIPPARSGIPSHAVQKAYRVAGLKASVYLARAALSQRPGVAKDLDLVGRYRNG